MTKPLLVALNLFFIFAYKVFLGGDLTINHNVPEQVTAGEVFTVEITIEKGDREGFAKWQQTIPQGLIAKAKETSGATFSFKNQELKLIWMAIPKQESFTISFDIETDPEIQGTFDLGGQFSYIEDNQRKDISSDPVSITINPAGQIVSNEEPTAETTSEPADSESASSDDSITESIDNDNETEPADLTEETLAEKKKDSTVKTETSQTQIELAEDELIAEDNDIIIHRKIQKLEPAKYEVTLTLEKGSLNSFGKVEEYLPPNYTATLSESNDAMFSFNRNVAKFLWMTLPNQESIEIKYYLESTSDELDEAVVHGVFSYLIDDDPKTLKLNPSRFENTFGDQFLAEEPSSEEVSEDNNTLDNDLTEETNDQTADQISSNTSQEQGEDIANQSHDPVADNTNEEEQLINEITDIPAPEASVAYKVQIAAGKREVNQRYFVDRHGIQENVNIEYHETWYKYTIGTFPIYKQARDRRNEVWQEENKIDDAFVTAYNSGERISVQEALMISQQKWYK